MILTTELTQRLLRLGYPQESANYTVALYISKGQIDELLARLEREEMAETQYICSALPGTQLAKEKNAGVMFYDLGMLTYYRPYVVLIECVYRHANQQ